MDFTKLKDVELAKVKYKKNSRCMFSPFPTNFLSVNNVSMHPWIKVLYYDRM